MTQLTTQNEKSLANKLAQATMEDIGISPAEAQRGHLVLCQNNSSGLRGVIPEAKPGDICDLLNKTVVGGPGKDVLFIPFKQVKYWNMINPVNNRKIKSIPVDLDNHRWTMDSLQEIEVKNEMGQIVTQKAKPSLVHNWFVILLEQAKEGFAMLYNLPLKGMSYPANGALTSFVMLSRGAKMLPFEKIYALSSVASKNAKGEFFVYQIKQHSKTPAEVMETCLFWWDALSTKSVDPMVEEDVD